MMSVDDKKYLIRMFFVMMTYLAVTYGSVWSLKNYELEGFRTIIAITPMLPMAFVVVVIMTWVRKMDEFECRVQFEACVFSLIVTGMITGTYGFMEGVGYPELGTEWIPPMLIILWGLGNFVARRRYLK